MDKNFSDLRREEADRKLDDFAAELSGTKSAGYRYTTSASDQGESRPDVRAKEIRKADAKLTALHALLASDPDYRELYNQARDAVHDAQSAAEKAMAAATQRFGLAEDALKDTQDKAAKLAPDGTRVYRNLDDGHVYTEDGRKLSPEQSASVVFPDDAPSYGEYRERKRAVDKARQDIDDIRRYQDRLGDYQNGLDDPNNPLSPDELRDIQRYAEEGLPGLTTDARPEVAPPKQEALPHNSQAVELPKV